MDMNTEWYRVFYRTALCGSLSKAAEVLHITQPAVSHTIKQLERQLDALVLPYAERRRADS